MLVSRTPVMCVRKFSVTISVTSNISRRTCAVLSHVLHRGCSSSLVYTHVDQDQLFKKELTHTILLHPSYFGPRMLNYLESKLYSDVEGTCSGQFGYIIAVVSILDIGKGMVLPGTGQAEFITRYRAIVFKPFKGEVVDGVVNNVSKVMLCVYVCRILEVNSMTGISDGFFCRCWPSERLRLPSGEHPRRPTHQCWLF